MCYIHLYTYFLNWIYSFQMILEKHSNCNQLNRSTQNLFLSQIPLEIMYTMCTI